MIEKAQFLSFPDGKSRSSGSIMTAECPEFFPLPCVSLLGCSDSMPRLCPVGVGIVIAHDPLHGSGRADFPHPALTSGNDAHAAQWIRMMDACGRQPTVDQASHSVPTNVASLAAARERLMPEQTCP